MLRLQPKLENTFEAKVAHEDKSLKCSGIMSEHFSAISGLSFDHVSTSQGSPLNRMLSRYERCCTVNAKVLNKTQRGYAMLAYDLYVDTFLKETAQIAAQIDQKQIVKAIELLRELQASDGRLF